MANPQVQAKVGNLNCSVSKQQTEAFAKAWDMGGIKMILDNTSIDFATAWANIALKSALEDPTVQMAIFHLVYAKLKAAKGQPQADSAVPVQANPVEAKPLITLTD